MKRGARITLIVVLCLAAAAVLWIWVFPWIDRTYINRPGVNG